MAFPTGWPPRVASGMRNIRFFLKGTSGGGFDANAYLFADQDAANPYTPLPDVRPGEDVSAPDYNGPHVVPPTPAGTGQHEDDPHPMIWSEAIRVINYGPTDLEISFDGVNVHGIVSGRILPILEVEQIFYERREAGIAVRGGGVVGTGTITTLPVISLIDGETFTLDDGINPPVVFEFDDDGSWTPGNIPVDISAPVVTADDVRDAIIGVINGLGDDVFLQTATNGGAGQVDLTQDVGGSQGNTTQTDTVVNVGFVVTDMTGAGDADFRIEAW
jgi:hypothetical protein